MYKLFYKIKEIKNQESQKKLIIEKNEMKTPITNFESDKMLPEINRQRVYTELFEIYLKTFLNAANEKIKKLEERKAR